jgi:hypothetical protein
MLTPLKSKHGGNVPCSNTPETNKEGAQLRRGREEEELKRRHTPEEVAPADKPAWGRTNCELRAPRAAVRGANPPEQVPPCACGWHGTTVLASCCEAAAWAKPPAAIVAPAPPLPLPPLQTRQAIARLGSAVLLPRVGAGARASLVLSARPWRWGDAASDAASVSTTLPSLPPSLRSLPWLGAPQPSVSCFLVVVRPLALFNSCFLVDFSRIFVVLGRSDSSIGTHSSAFLLDPGIRNLSSEALFLNT